jgi:glucokinase
VIGIDIGGTKTIVARVDVCRGAILERQVIETYPRETSGPPFAEELARLARALSDSKAHAVGIGICEVVERGARIVSRNRLVMDEADIAAAFASFPAVTIESDVRAAALAEAHFGNGRGREHWIYVNAGTGVSSVLMSGRTCYLGAHGWAIGLGTSPADMTSPHSVLIEDIAGGAGIMRLARDRKLHARSVREVREMARSGDRTAGELLDYCGAALGGGLGTLINILDPEAVIVGGGLAAENGPYWQALVAAAARHVWHVPGKATPVLRSALNTDAGVIGAALRGSNREELKDHQG